MAELGQIFTLAVAGVFVVFLALVVLQGLTVVISLLLSSRELSSNEQKTHKSSKTGDAHIAAVCASTASAPSNVVTPPLKVVAPVVQDGMGVNVGQKTPSPEVGTLSETKFIETGGNQNSPSAGARTSASPFLPTTTITSRLASSRTRIQKIPSIYPNAVEADIAAIVIAVNAYRSKHKSNKSKSHANSNN